MLDNMRNARIIETLESNIADRCASGYRGKELKMKVWVCIGQNGFIYGVFSEHAKALAECQLHDGARLTSEPVL